MQLLTREICFGAECDVPVPGIFHFFGGIRTGIGTNWYRTKVSEPVSDKFGTGKKDSEPVSDKFGTGKKSRNQYRKNLVPQLIFVVKI